MQVMASGCCGGGVQFAGRAENAQGRRSIRSRSSLAMFLVSACFVFAHQSRGGAAEYTLENVKEGYRASIAALDPIWIRCKLAKTYAFEVPEWGWKSFEGDSVEWAIDGAKFHYQWQSRNTSFWFSYDGKSTWYLDYGFAQKGEDPQKVKCAERQRLETRTDSMLRSFISPGRWLGLYFNAGSKAQSGDSVSTMLEKPSAQLVGSEEVDGHQCVRVNLIYDMLVGEDIPTRNEVPIQVWFDPEVGFLPRRIVVNWTSSTDDYSVEEFKTISAPDGPAVFFPWRMKCLTTNHKNAKKNRTNQLAVEAARIGEPAAENLFKPELADGVPVFNMDNQRQRLAWQDFLSGDSPEKRKARLDAAAARMRREPSAVPAGLQPKMAATPTGGWPWSITLVVIGVVLLVGATWQFVRR